MALTLAGCGWFGPDEEDGAVGVLEVEVGQCFLAPDEVEAELSVLQRVACDVPHDQEAFAVVGYQSPDGQEPPGHPGEDVLSRFADGACVEQFGDYVGTHYLDSELYFTYLLPSVRGWEAGDSEIVCFVTSTGEKFEETVRGSAR
nr:septum formation family protein [Phytoactinopolyspora alkaliphila]